MKPFKHLLLAATLISGNLYAAPVLDRIAVQVDNGVILQSDIDNMVAEIKRSAQANKQQLPSDNALNVQVTERLVLTQLQLQMAERMGLQIGDLQLDQAIENIAREQGLTLNQMREQIEASGMNYASYREKVREEITIGEVQRINVRRRIQITPQEMNSLVELIKEQGMQNTAFHIGHILIEASSNSSSEELEASKKRAEKTLEVLKDGGDFRRTAIAASSGPKALEGGDWGYMNANEMPTLFAEVANTAKKGDIIGPIKSAAGFHIITIFDIKGQEIQEISESNARHILLKPSPILSEDRAKQMLEGFLVQINNGEAKFEELAKKYSEDPGSALKGGELGWADPNIYVPAFKDAMAQLEINGISKPFRSSHGWHIVQIIDRRTSDATDKFNTDRAYQLIYRRKFNDELQSWLSEIRSEAYVEEISPLKRRG
ncbi:peptidylprolyl isomerase SurA [Paraferrimonas sp. SM1919]|uniref:peptidylprolyl isomerase SurA n=1 Tax=Paraferrimonas sp. SM1919 TaxID=2662263 RepID=UPI0013D0D555|nr:peptidylprolyl isomerase SurA [Paraferrimonas sp. SM1919]